MGTGAPVAQLGVRVGGARSRAAPGGPPAARRARPRVAAADVRQLARPRRPAVDRDDPPPDLALSRRPLQARRCRGVDAGHLRGPRGHPRGRRRRLQGPVRDGGRGPAGARRHVRARHRLVPGRDPRGPARPARGPGGAGPAFRSRLLRRAHHPRRRPRQDADQPDPRRQHQAVPHGQSAAPARALRARRGRWAADVRRRDGRAWRRARADPAPRVDLPPRRAERRGAQPVQRPRPARGPTDEPVASGTGGNGLSPGNAGPEGQVPLKRSAG